VPFVTPVIFFHLVTSVIGAFQFFAIPYVMTGGTGFPANSLLLYSIWLYKNAFQYFRMGYASALAWLLFITILVITLIIFGTARRWVYYGGSEP
jgi:multiple sugar transport system permease protein